MIIVQGIFRIAPDQRDQYLAQSVEQQRISRGEKGCLEYVLAADPLESDRVVLSERWESRADLDAHLQALYARREEAAQAGGDEAIAPLHIDVAFYEATQVEAT